MIQEQKKDLVDRQEFYQRIAQRINEQSNGATLNSVLTLREIIEIFNELPLYNEPIAEWIKENNKWVCTWCRMGSHAPYTTKYCPSCGRRMKVKVIYNGSTKR